MHRMQKNESQEVLKIKEKLQEQKKALREEISHAINVICKFGVIEDMDNVCTYDTFKVRVEHQLAKKRKEIIDSKINDEYGTVFMGDMDNLGRVNRVHNESIVDSTICNVIKDIRKALDNNDIGRYDIGKLGDEIYIYVPDKINKDANEIVNQLNRIEETVQDNVGVETGPCNDHIGISFGSSKDFSHGLEDAIEQAENEMAKNKFQKKITKIREAIENKNGKEFGINCFLEEIDSKLRIDKKKLTPEQLELYKKNKKDCIEKIIQEYIEQQSLETAKREKEAELESFIKKDLEREKEKVKKQFPE